MNQLEQLLAAVNAFAAIDKDMPLQMVRLFLVAAMKEGLNLKDLADRARVPRSVASRHVLDMGDINRYREEGHLLLECTPDPNDRRLHLVHVAPKGAALLGKLITIMAGCKYPECDGGYATGYCHTDCKP